MQAAEPPAIVVPSAPDEDIIEVVATRPDQAQKIDRRIYRVKETPHSAQADSLQLLRGLPAVTITPDDQILLLGAAGVTILVDERPVHGDAIQYLRTLHGSDIERIEIITNPSAQYSALGTGGIINFVLKQTKSEGLTGSGSVEASSLGHFEATGSVKEKKGKWTYEVQLQGRAGRYARSTYHKLRTVGVDPANPTINTEDGGGSARSSNGYVSGKVTYELDPKTNISVEAFGGGGINDSRNDIEFVGLTPDFATFSEVQRPGGSATFLGSQVSFDRKGKTDGETLKGSAVIFGNPRDDQHLFDETSDGGAYSKRQLNQSRFANANVDWVHPIGKDRILSLGAGLETESHDRRYIFSSVGGTGLFGPDADESFSSDQRKTSAYATFQKTFGNWIVMPGVRLERLDRTIKSPGFPTSKVTRTNLFPTFHLEHPLSKSLNLTLSYSKRFDLPFIDNLRPFPVFLGALAIENGNPNLRDQSTDAYELNLHYSRKKLEIGLIIYDRETDRVWSGSYFVNANGLNVSSLINAGHKSDRGAEFDVSTPLFKRMKGTASINLFSSRVPIDPVNSDDFDESFRYTGNATIEWRGKDRPKRPGDIAQLQLTYESPSRSFQIRRDSQYSLNLSWTHSFSRSAAMTASIDGIGSTRYGHRLIAPTIQELYERRDRNPVFELKLTKALGTPK